MNTKLQDAIRKAQGLIALADDPASTPEEAATARTKADAIMFKYKIDALSAPEDSTFGASVVFQQMVVCRAYSEFRFSYEHMTGFIVDHADCLSVTKYEQDGAGVTNLILEIIGLESDVAHAEMLITGALLAFGKALEPVYDPTKSDAENAYRMRAAGMEGHRIARAIWNDDAKPNRVKARKLAKEYMVSIGEDPEGLFGRGVNVKAFREDYAKAFVSHLDDRLWRIRAARGADRNGLVLANAEERVREAMYERYPQLRPVEYEPSAPLTPWRAPNADCKKCEKASSGYCREHGYLKPSNAKARPGRYISEAGIARGQAAARNVDLGASPTGRVNGSNTRKAL